MTTIYNLKYNIGTTNNAIISNNGINTVTLTLYDASFQFITVSNSAIFQTFDGSQTVYITNDFYGLNWAKTSSATPNAIQSMRNLTTNTNIAKNNIANVKMVLNSFQSTSDTANNTSNSVETIVSINENTTYYLVVATNNSNTVSNLNFEAIRIA